MTINTVVMSTGSYTTRRDSPRVVEAIRVEIVDHFAGTVLGREPKSGDLRDVHLLR